MASVLVIDDDGEMRATLRATLESAGYEVQEAQGGQEGFDAQCRREADVIIADMYMPDKDGLETIAQIRRSFPEAKILAISGGVLHDAVLQAAKRVGATETLSKPFNPEELLHSVETTLKFG